MTDYDECVESNYIGKLLARIAELEKSEKRWMSEVSKVLIEKGKSDNKVLELEESIKIKDEKELI